jgi:hypothetical protein
LLRVESAADYWEEGLTTSPFLATMAAFPKVARASLIAVSAAPMPCVPRENAGAGAAAVQSRQPVD